MAQTPAPVTADQQTACRASLLKLDPKAEPAKIQTLCASAKRLNECHSVSGLPIEHFNFPDPHPKSKRILVFGLIHGDEPLSGLMATRWAQRLNQIDHRNEWRVVPVLNPDGFAKHTRTNQNNVDLNRNFPTKDWDDDAVKFWRKTAASEKRRYPGPQAASEPETKCAMAHIQDFRPDFIVSIHTPYNVLDFDGPHLSFPPYKPIPWRALGNFPGSLGRFMWRDHQTPVLTIELKETLVNPEDLQDMIGTFAMKSSDKAKSTGPLNFERLPSSSSGTLPNPGPASPKQADL